MEFVGTYQGRKVVWIDKDNYTDQLPDVDWVCLAIANTKPDKEHFDAFTRCCIHHNLLEFKGQGNFGEQLHGYFDETMVIMEVMEGYDYINIMTTGDDTDSFSNVFWQCFFVTCLPETADLNNITIAVIDLDGNNRIQELKTYLEEFKNG